MPTTKYFVSGPGWIRTTDQRIMRLGEVPASGRFPLPNACVGALRYRRFRRSRIPSGIRFRPLARKGARPRPLAVDFVVEADRAQVSEVVQRVRDGRLRTNIGTVAALDDAVAAFNPTERIKGKTPGSPNGRRRSSRTTFVSFARTASPAHGATGRCPCTHSPTTDVSCCRCSGHLPRHAG